MTSAALLKIQADHKAGLLGYHSRHAIEEGLCLYVYNDGRHCGIGACMTPSQLSTYGDDEDTSIGDLINKGEKIMDLPDSMARSVQDAHDWLVSQLSSLFLNYQPDTNSWMENYEQINTRVVDTKERYATWLDTIGLEPDPSWHPITHLQSLGMVPKDVKFTAN